MSLESNSPIVDDLIEINDPEIDPEAIMATLRARIQARREELGDEQRKFPSFATVAPEEPLDLDYDPNLYHHLRLANDSYMQFPTRVALAPSPATRVPILGRLWNMVRQGAHNLVVYYVNRAVNHQVSVNRHLVSVVNHQTLQLEAQQRQINALLATAAASPPAPADDSETS